ncbi:UBC-like protein, partial [Ramicandelaber brevisporus]
MRQHELVLEFAALRMHCPRGVYVVPQTDNMHIWHGVAFIHDNMYDGGIFRFVIDIPAGEYPHRAPSVVFSTSMFHPLIDAASGVLAMRPRFPTWVANQDRLCHVLFYIKGLFDTPFLDALNEQMCSDKNAYRFYKTDRVMFRRLAEKCANNSRQESAVYD